MLNMTGYGLRMTSEGLVFARRETKKQAERADKAGVPCCIDGHQWRVIFIDLPAWGLVRECTCCGTCRPW